MLCSAAGASPPPIVHMLAGTAPHIEDLSFESVEVAQEQGKDYMSSGLLTPMLSDSESRRASTDSQEWNPSFDASPPFHSNNLVGLGDGQSAHGVMPNPAAFQAGYGFDTHHSMLFNPSQVFMADGPHYGTATPPSTYGPVNAGPWMLQPKALRGPYYPEAVGSTMRRAMSFPAGLTNGSQSFVDGGPPWPSTLASSASADPHSTLYNCQDSSMYTQYDALYSLEDCAPYHVQQQSCSDTLGMRLQSPQATSLALLRDHTGASSLSSLSESSIVTDADSDWKPSRSVLASRPRVIRKGQRLLRARKKPHISARVLQGDTFDLQVEDIGMTLDGLPPSMHHGREETNRCHLKLKDGRPCPRAFRRIEHLKRHYRTDMHSTERPFICCVPECPKAFSRNDNLQAHYDTHWSEAKAGRNSRVPFDELCQHIRNAHPSDVADIKIKSLEKRRACGKVVEARKC